MMNSCTAPSKVEARGVIINRRVVLLNAACGPIAPENGPVLEMGATATAKTESRAVLSSTVVASSVVSQSYAHEDRGSRNLGTRPGTNRRDLEKSVSEQKVLS